MPQDGANNYYYPPGTPGIQDQTIESEAYNTFLDDLVLNDLNIARPIHRGGTGATTANQALVNLKAEVSKQVVTNYDSHLWLNGSFASETGATGAPTSDAKYAGVYYEHIDTNYAMIEARNVSTGLLYMKAKVAGTWGPWTQTPTTYTELNTQYVNVGGDTITGGLNVQGALQQNGSNVWTTANFNPASPGVVSLGAGSTVPTPSPGGTTNIATAWLVEDRANHHAVTQANTKVSKAGDTMTGDLTMQRSGNPAHGQINFGNVGRALYWDGSAWTFSAGIVYAGGMNCATGTYTGGGIAIYGTSWYFNSAGIQAASGYKPGGGDWIDTSDSRIKNTLGDYIKGLDVIKQLTPKVFTYKGNDILAPAQSSVPAGSPDPMSTHYQVAIDGKQFAGLIAQEAEAVMPELVTQIAGIIDGTSVTDLRTLDTGPLIYVLVNAVKELAARVEQLEAV